MSRVCSKKNIKDSKDIKITLSDCFHYNLLLNYVKTGGGKVLTQIPNFRVYWNVNQPFQKKCKKKDEAKLINQQNH